MSKLETAYAALLAERDGLRADFDEVNEDLHAARAALSATSEDIAKFEIPRLLEELTALRAIALAAEHASYHAKNCGSFFLSNCDCGIVELDAAIDTWRAQQ